jgi:DNA-directed RNA polymerase specialized sigma subunit
MDNTKLPPITPQANPFDYKEAKKKDLDLFNTWKETGDKKALGKLISQLHPVIYSEVRRQSGTLPESALSAEAKTWALKAIQTFDPSKGVALSTHVMNYLPKVRRLNYKFQNAARLPENLQLQFSEFKNVVSHLTEVLNREPTDDEVAEELGWSKGAVIKFKGSLYEDLVESSTQRPFEATQFNYNSLLLSHIISKLDPQEKIILEDSGTLSSSELANKIGVNISRLNYLKSKLKDKIQAMKNEIGMF